jgi:DNA-binding transcriptional ArsR family regulator
MGRPSNIMTGKSATGWAPTEIFSALSDPIRWSILMQAASVDELAAVTLDKTLPVAKPTISYHVKILQNAGLISTRKAGRNYYYALRRDVIGNLIDGLWELAPSPRLVTGTHEGSVSRSRPRRPNRAERPTASGQRAVNDVEEVAVLTW